MPFRIKPIVEGDGEEKAVPVLLRRITVRLNPAIEVLRPMRQSRGRLLNPEGIEKAVELAARELGGTGAVLILLDSEGDCPATLGPQILARAKNARSDKRVSVVLAHQEFESWFLAAASSLKGARGLGPDIENHPKPETVKGCKEWLRHRMPRGRKYSETLDQPALSSIFDLELARKAPSFDKLYRELEQICREAQI